MNKRQFAFSMAVCMIFGMGLARLSHAGWFVDTNVPVNSNNSYNSNNPDERGSRNNNSVNLDHGLYSTTSISDNRYDNRQDSSVRYTDSFNTDNRDYSNRSVNDINNSDNRKDNSIRDAFNDYGDHSNRSVDNSVDSSYHEAVGGSKRVDSNDIAVGGDVKSSVMGNFNQTYLGTDLRSGISGSGNTIDARSINATTLGDTIGAMK